MSAWLLNPLKGRFVSFVIAAEHNSYLHATCTTSMLTFTLSYCTPPVCVPAVIGALAVWRLSTNKKKESYSEVCMCGMSTQQWPNTRITLFERTRQSAWQDDDTSWQEACDFLCIKTPPFLSEFSNNALSDALLMSRFQKFAGQKKETARRSFEGFN